MAAERYADQVQLLVRTIPEIAREEMFALKGGTAINLFLRDLPRLSVDIDLVYLPVGDRQLRSTLCARGSTALPTGCRAGLGSGSSGTFFLTGSA